MNGKVRRTKGMTESEIRIGGMDREGVSRFLAYALPRGKDDNKAIIHELDDFDLHDLPLRHSDSFTDFEAVVCFAGAFEEITLSRSPGLNYQATVRWQHGDLDRREREFHTLYKSGVPFIFLVPAIMRSTNFKPNDHTDLFRRVVSMLPIDWDQIGQSVAHFEPGVPEFRPYFDKYGVAYVRFSTRHDHEGDFSVICGNPKFPIAFGFARKLFFLPCRNPQTHADAVEMTAEAVRAVMAYRKRMSEEMPEWVGEFQFTKETSLREMVDQHRTEIVRLETELDGYTKRKGALCYRSEPLVGVVISILESILGLRIESEEQCIEDARVLDDGGNIIAVVEIKGVNGSFTRQHVNQVDSHRERLALTPETPGLLIMNTKMTADLLADKDEAPHPDIIQKAAQDNVLLIRTLDLLRYADLVETAKLTKEAFRSTILSERGWLKVEGETATVARE